MKNYKLLMLKLCYPTNICKGNYRSNESLWYIYKVEKIFIELSEELNNSSWVIYPPLN